MPKLIRSEKQAGQAEVLATTVPVEAPAVGERPDWRSVSGHLEAMKRLDSKLKRSEGNKTSRSNCSSCGERAQASCEGSGRTMRKKATRGSYKGKIW